MASTEGPDFESHRAGDPPPAAPPGYWSGGYPGPYQPPAWSPGQQLSQASMILGILSLFVVGIILGPIAIVKANQAEQEYHTDATVGKVTGWIGTILGALQILAVILWVIFMIGFVSLPYVIEHR